MRHVIFGHHETAACFLVETMNDTGPFFSADPGQRSAVAEQRVDQSMLALTCARVNGKASRFIDNDDVVIFEDYLEWNRLRLDIDLLHRRLGHTDCVAASNDLPRSGGLLVEPNEPAADQLLKARTGISRKSLRQKLIKAQLRVVFSYNKLDRLRIVQRFGSRSEQEDEQE